MQKFIPFISVLILCGLLGCKSDDVSSPEQRSAFQAYDGFFFDSLQKHWHALIAGSAPGKPGVVMLDFRLLPDGSVSDIQIARCTTDDKYIPIAKKTITDLVPFPSWPEEMRRVCKSGYRDIHFVAYVQ